MAYDRRENWVVLPETLPESFPLIRLNHTATDTATSTEVVRTSADNPFQVFYVHPTLYIPEESGDLPSNSNPAMYEANATLFDPSPRDAAFLQIINRVARLTRDVFAPRYREMRYDLYFSNAELYTKALEIAYLSVSDAFEYFMAHYRIPSKPLVLVSHSQGTQHLLALLTNRRNIPENLHAVVAPGIYENIGALPHVQDPSWSFERLRARVAAETKLFAWNFQGSRYASALSPPTIWCSSVPASMLTTYDALTLDRSTYADYLMPLANFYGLPFPAPSDEPWSMYEYRVDSGIFQLAQNRPCSSIVEFTSRSALFKVFEVQNLHYLDLNLVDWTLFL